MSVWNAYIQQAYRKAPVPAYSAERFDHLVADSKADSVIVTSVDATHDQYIIRAMQQGCDVVTEKPMTTDEGKIDAIFDAIRRSGRSLRVAFNYRWQPAFSLVEEVVSSGRIGKTTLVDFQ